MLDRISVDQTVISFPGLGIGEFLVNRIALRIGALEIRWYGVIIALGMILAFLYGGYRGKKNNIKFDDIIDLGLFAVICGVIGARLYYVIMEHESYHSFMDVIAIWNGGLAIYGGIIGGALGVFVTAKVKKMNFPLCADIILPGVMIAQALGRWGNFFNGEAYGGIVSEGNPLYFLRMGIFPNNVATGLAYVHPTFLYESLWNVLGFVIINILWNRN
jgi:phosphatidylglycerol:prolipoprotein diacylglycerol transferase